MYLFFNSNTRRGMGSSKNDISIPNTIITTVEKNMSDQIVPFLFLKTDQTLSISSIINPSKVQLLHSIPDTNPANGIPEIPGDGVSTASITIQIRTGDTYSIQKNGPGEWDYEEVKVADGQLIDDNTYEGKKLNLFTDKGMLNKRSVILDANSTGSFKIKSEAKTCIGKEAATITITSEDINDILGTSMKIEFAPVDF